MIKTHIKTFAQLVTYFEQTQVTIKEMKQILAAAKIFWIYGDENKEDVIRELKVFWQKWGQVRERPLFLD